MDKILLFNNKDLDKLISMIDPCLYNLVLSTLCEKFYLKKIYRYLPDYAWRSLDEIRNELKNMVDLSEKGLPSYYVLYVYGQDANEITEFTFCNDVCLNAKLYMLDEISIKECLPDTLYQELCNSIEYYKKNGRKLRHSFHVQTKL